MQEMVIYGVSFDMVGKQPIVLLKTVAGNKFLPIWIGHAEAAAILMKLQGTDTPRPMTHDLVTQIMGELNAHVAKITVTELRDNTFYALITLKAETSEIDVDSAPPTRSHSPCAPTHRSSPPTRSSRTAVSSSRDEQLVETMLSPSSRSSWRT